MSVKTIPFIVLSLGALSLVSGCAINRATASLTPDADLRKIRVMYVVKAPGEKHDVDQIIVALLVRRGYEVSSGLPERPSYPIDAVVTYVDKWTWDFTMYMLELTITLRDPSSGFPLAVGNSFHTSLTRKSPQEMVDEVITNILSAK